MTRDERERELKAILKQPGGRDQLTELLRQHLNLTPGQTLPLSGPIIQTILRLEFGDDDQPSDDWHRQPC